jgi:hypothetical protein
MTVISLMFNMLVKDEVAWVGLGLGLGLGLGMVWFGLVWYGMVWYGMVWYGMVWYGMAWHGMAWHGMAWHGVKKQVLVTFFHVLACWGERKWCGVWIWFGIK